MFNRTGYFPIAPRQRVLFAPNMARAKRSTGDRAAL